MTPILNPVSLNLTLSLIKTAPDPTPDPTPLILHPCPKDTYTSQTEAGKTVQSLESISMSHANQQQRTLTLSPNFINTDNLPSESLASRIILNYPPEPQNHFTKLKLWQQIEPSPTFDSSSTMSTTPTPHPALPKGSMYQGWQT